MSTVIPPSEEVVSMYQRDWDILQKKTKFWLSTMSNTVCGLVALIIVSLLVWAVAGVAQALGTPEGMTSAAIKDAMARPIIALIATIVMAALFDVMRKGMNRVRWRAAERLGDRPRNDDHKADDYDMLEVSSYYTPDNKFIATVNGWSFLVTRMVNQTKDGKHTMDFAFDEIGRLQPEKARMGFGSSATMDEGTEMQQDDIIRMALSKIAHQYPALQSPPAVERYSQ